ncbi:hypothetical protein C7M79_18925 [Clostridium botulinum]|uniref:hypothetical protein n=1 Tax=Clostridium botulinum TaxID=1491 RepID=UPI000D2265C3|nr:hypothetical protein C7M79_18925 [Clostridium botulinum]
MENKDLNALQDKINSIKTLVGENWLLQECFLLILCLIFKDHIALATFISYQICCSLSRTFFQICFLFVAVFQRHVLL